MAIELPVTMIIDIMPKASDHPTREMSDGLSSWDDSFIPRRSGLRKAETQNLLVSKQLTTIERQLSR